jgi:iron complex transport system permease protein
LALLLGLSLLLPAADLLALARTDAPLAATILLELRLPRAALALIYGATLGASGAAVQALFANPLASPDITGTSSGAALGAVVAAYLLGATGRSASPSAASSERARPWRCCWRSPARVRTRRRCYWPVVAISALAGAATALALALAPSPFAFYDAFQWLMGSFVDRSLPQLAVAACGAGVALALLGTQVARLDRLALGEEVAQSIGDDPARTRAVVITATALGVGACVAVCGAVGFVGLVAPVIARAWSGHHPGRAVWPAAALGAALMLGADLLVRLAPLGRALPVGVVTALIGAPLFVRLVVKSRGRPAL